MFWLDMKNIPTANLIWNMRELLEILESDKYSEFFFRIENGIHGLENIQIRLIPAKELYDHYLSQGKIDIGRLEL